MCMVNGDDGATRHAAIVEQKLFMKYKLEGIRGQIAKYEANPDYKKRASASENIKLIKEILDRFTNLIEPKSSQ